MNLYNVLFALIVAFVIIIIVKSINKMILNRYKNKLMDLVDRLYDIGTRRGIQNGKEYKFLIKLLDSEISDYSNRLSLSDFYGYIMARAKGELNSKYDKTIEAINSDKELKEILDQLMTLLNKNKFTFLPLYGFILDVFFHLELFALKILCSVSKQRLKRLEQKKNEYENLEINKNTSRDQIDEIVFEERLIKMS